MIGRSIGLLVVILSSPLSIHPSNGKARTRLLRRTLNGSSRKRCPVGNSGSESRLDDDLHYPWIAILDQGQRLSQAVKRQQMTNQRFGP